MSKVRHAARAGAQVQDVIDGQRFRQHVPASEADDLDMISGAQLVHRNPDSSGGYGMTPS